MEASNYFKVQWKQADTSTFMYGTKFSFKNGQTLFENPLMPSGVIIQEWGMITSYAKDKEIPTLPILKKGHTYRFHFNYQVVPHNGIYFKIVFFSKNGTIIDTKIIKNKQVDIHYPEEAYSYKIQLINAASQQLIFNQLTIIEKSELEYKQKCMHMSKLINKDLSYRSVNMIFIEPSYLMNVALSEDAIRNIHNVVLVDDWQSDKLEKHINDLKEKIEMQYGNFEVHLIGYGPQSNEIVKVLSKITGMQALITSHHHKRLAQQLESVMKAYQSHPRAQTHVYDVANNNEHLGTIDTVMNNARFLEYIDIDRLNCGGSHET